MNHFSFSQLLGVSHTRANLLYTPGGGKILSCVGNKISTLDLLNNVIETTLSGHVRDVDFMDINQTGNILVLTSKDGYVTFLSYPKGVILRSFMTHPGLSLAKFSEDGKLVFMGGRGFSIFKYNSKENYSTPFEIIRKKSSLRYSCCDWVGSTFIATGSFEGVVSLFKYENQRISHNIVLAGCVGQVIGIFFRRDQNGRNKDPSQLFCCDSTGNFFHWRFHQKQGWKVFRKKNLEIEVSSFDYNPAKEFIIIGTPKGSYSIFSISTDDDFELVSELKFSESPISSILLDPKGNLVAAGSSTSDQLLIWDWSAESFVVKQVGHVSPITALAYSPNGDIVASGDQNGKIKVWRCRTGQCFVTLDAHKAKITSMKFSRPPGSRDPALFVSSADGTCRAFDVIRFKNFQTFVSPKQTGFNAMTINPSGEVIAASGELDFKIYVWNVKTKQLLETLTSHTAPVTSLHFTTRGLLTSSGWDGLVKLWDVFSSNKQPMDLEHSHEVITHAVREDGDEVVSSSASGELQFWDVRTGDSNGIIDCKRDIQVEAAMGEMGTKLKEVSKKYFTQIKYTFEGKRLLCGGQTPFLFLYSVPHRILIKRILFGVNLSVSGTLDTITTPFYEGRLREQQRLYKRYVHSRSKKQGKAIGEQFIPGSENELLRRVGCTCLEFSPTQRSFCCGTSEGIFVFSMGYRHNNSSFRPLDLDPSIRTSTVYEKLKSGEFVIAVAMSLRLGEEKVTRKTVLSVPVDSVREVVGGLPYPYLSSLLSVLGKELEDGKEIEFILIWIRFVLSMRGEEISEEIAISTSSLDKGVTVTSSTQILASLRVIIRGLRGCGGGVEGIRKISIENGRLLSYLQEFRWKGTHGKRNLLKEIGNKKGKKKRKIDDDL